jgi:folate-binding protein YgfZ
MTAYYTPLSDSVCIEVRGADADAFLHGQLSRAVAALPPDRAPLAAWLDARGRVRALVRVHRLADRWLLVTPRDGAEALVKKLTMFVMRSAVTLGVALDVAVGGIVGATPAWLEAEGFPADAAAEHTFARGELRFTRIGADYWQVLGPPSALEPFAQSLPATSAAAAAAAEIGLGIPLVTAVTGERFVAQMLNLDELGAVAFDKGCYPGQEIVARVHNLGGVKRRVRRYAGPRDIAVGASVVVEGAAIGEVVRCAPTAAGTELLALVDNAAAASVPEVGNAPLRELPLPFRVPSD